MKLKSLKKKIERLERRLREGPKKLVKLKQKLKAAQARKQSAARARAARQTAQSSRPVKKTPAKTVGAKTAVQKVKRKLNLSPERRAQLAATMKARWAAKRAEAEANTKSNGDFTLQQAPQVAVVEVVGTLPAN